MASPYRWVVFIHILFVFGFLIAHGTSVAVALKLRRERDRERLKGYLDLSSITVGIVHLTIFGVVITGVALGFMRRWWGQAWIWLSLALLIALFASMSVFGTRFYDRVRLAVGTTPFYDPKRLETSTTASDAERQGLLATSRPIWIAAVGVVGLLVILWLMIFKPF